MSRSVRILLEEILESADRVQSYVEMMTFEDFENDVEKQDSVIRRIEIIGEAAKGLPSDFRATYDYVPWTKIAGARDVFVHQYFRVDLVLVWDMVRQDLPHLVKHVREILQILD